MNNVNIIYRCPVKKAIYLSNGDVLDGDSYNYNKQQISVAKLKQNPEAYGDPSKAYLIIGNNSNSVIGYFNAQTNTPIYLNQMTNSQHNSGEINLLMGMQQRDNGISTYVDNTPVVMGNGSTNVNTNIPNTPKPSPLVEKPSIQSLPILPGLEFLPVPTDYNRIEWSEVNGFKQWKILIGEDKMNEASHNEIYSSLAKAAKAKGSYKLHKKNVMIPLNSKSDIASFYLLAGSNEVTLITGLKSTGFYSSSESIINSGLNTSNLSEDTVYVPEVNSVIRNKLHTIALKCNRLTTFADWLALANDNLTRLEKTSIEDYVFDLFSEHLTSIDNEIPIDRSVFKIWTAGSAIETELSKEPDLVKRECYLNAVSAITRRLIDIDNINNYSYLKDAILAPEFNMQDCIFVGGGISELVPVIVVNNDSIDLELVKFLKQTKDEWNFLTVNTQNLLDLVKAIYTGNNLTVVEGTYDLKESSSIPLDMFYLLVSSHVVKVIRNESGKYLINLVM